VAKQPRPDPIEEGSLKLIYKWFIGPLIIYKPASHSIKEWLEELFDIKHRDITRYVVMKPFHMPGLYCETAATKIQGVGYRTVKKDEVLWVRTDGRRPNVIDVEWLGGQGRKDQVFSLSADQWRWVKRHLFDVKEIEE
jgi:hypothetical protein